jgi:hypothetical protein
LRWLAGTTGKASLEKHSEKALARMGWTDAFFRSIFPDVLRPHVGLQRLASLAEKVPGCSQFSFPSGLKKSPSGKTFARNR